MTEILTADRVQAQLLKQGYNLPASYAGIIHRALSYGYIVTDTADHIARAVADLGLLTESTIKYRHPDYKVYLPSSFVSKLFT